MSKKEKFFTGAQRDTHEGKLRFDLTSPFADEREAELMRIGAEKYEVFNFMKGIPMQRCYASLMRHAKKWLYNEMLGIKQDEDHLAAVVFNAKAIMHYEEGIKRGIYPKELNDIPKYADLLNKNKESEVSEDEN